MLPARTVLIPDRGEFFLRDSGETDPARPTAATAAHLTADRRERDHAGPGAARANSGGDR